MEIRLKEENDRLRQRQMLREDEIKDLRFWVVHYPSMKSAQSPGWNIFKWDDAGDSIVKG